MICSFNVGIRDKKRGSNLYLIPAFSQVFNSYLLLVNKYFNDLDISVFSFFRREHHKGVVDAVFGQHVNTAARQGVLELNIVKCFEGVIVQRAYR